MTPDSNKSESKILYAYLKKHIIWERSPAMPDGLSPRNYYTLVWLETNVAPSDYYKPMPNDNLVVEDLCF